MKLFLLKACDDLPRANDPWMQPEADDLGCVGAVIQAADMLEARETADAWLSNSSWREKGFSSPWLEDCYSSCRYLGEAAGEEVHVILTDFR